jgi:hypothetical protein
MFPQKKIILSMIIEIYNEETLILIHYLVVINNPALPEQPPQA